MTVTNCTTGSVRIKGGQKQLLVTRKIYKKKITNGIFMYIFIEVCS